MPALPECVDCTNFVENEDDLLCSFHSKTRHSCLNPYCAQRVSEEDALCTKCSNDSGIRECPYCHLLHEAMLPCPIVTDQGWK